MILGPYAREYIPFGKQCVICHPGGLEKDQKMDFGTLRNLGE